MQYGLGVDLGTTQTAAAVRVDGRVEVVRLGGRRAEIPSLVFVRPDGGLLIGEAAERRGHTEPGRLAREFKRRIGDPVPILVGGVPFSAHALTAKLLRHVLDTVAQLQGGPPAVLTVTHPANWGPYKREQLDQALRLADTGPVLLRTEPEAAALQHATARRIAPGETVAVYDLGGGTFDAAVLRRDGEGFQLLGEPEGIEQLGGADFDEAVFGHVIGVLGGMIEGLNPDEPDVITALARLRRDCVEAKEALSFDTEVMIPVALPGLHTRVRLNRSELESMIAPALEDTVTAMHRALRQAGVAPGELDAVLLAGGSSRIPLVSQLLSTAFDRPIVADPHPEHSIALGAAVSTALITGGVSPFAGAVAPPTKPRTAAATGTAADSGPASTPGTPGTPADAVAGTAAGTVAPAGGAGARAVPAAATAATAATTAGAAPAARSTVAQAKPASGAGTPVAVPHETGAAPASRSTATQAKPASGTGTPVAVPHEPGANGASAATTQVMPGAGGPPTTVVPGRSAAPGAGNPAGTAYGSAAPVAFSRGAAAVPGTTQQFGAVPPGGAAPPVAPGSPITYPPMPPGLAGDEPPRRNARLLIMAGALTLAVIAGTTAVVIALNRGDDAGKDDTAAQPPASPSAAPPPYPTDTMLIRVDTGDDWPKGTTAIKLLTPGSPERTLISDNGADVLPEWSRDRKKIALTRRVSADNNEIWVMDADGGNAKKVIDDVTGGRTTWSADGTKLAFMRKVDGKAQIFVLKIGESDPTQLTSSDIVKDDPAWSPDGKTIAYWAEIDGERQIYLLTVKDPQEPGKQITKGDQGPAYDPAWSPDGTTIAYTHGTGPGISDIWLVGSDGKNARELTSDPEREMDPSWAPGNTGWLAFTRGVLEKPKITIIKSDGTDEETLTQGDAREGHPCWS
ncbi:Hsp70 family protein [Amorphoplanes digitatis]|uniref:Tol biopolymer transport system component/actin-like ATPase involved in cell morphogenesis n=1 Tax=Actinoplanes digitatis TaxID=1868 RepID=A0A7W7HX84_9ACTN|nr:Hsp70 family protein [Actinoplanes digitatis]MBB4762390.1 Tol biopolymer transport system component/actin-like ATPase involved in cell morphogenesis [Actinoplanes digitatis]